MRYMLLILATMAATGCGSVASSDDAGDDAQRGGQDAVTQGDATADARTDDARTGADVVARDTVVSDTVVRDVAVTDAASSDGASGDGAVFTNPYVPHTCGDGVLDLCTAGETVSCASLAASYASGTATCRADCTGYDVSSCTRVSGPSTGSETVRVADRDPARWATARCNDGTSGAMQVRLSPTGSHDWVIRFQAGGLCDDYRFLCRNRGTGNWNSTLPADRTLGTTWGQHGVIASTASENPDFADANLVHVDYCSSDLWSGTRTDPVVTTHPGPTYFSGALIVNAVLEALTQRYGLADADSNARALVVGISAGGAGMVTNAEHIARTFPVLASSQRMRFVIDGAFWASGTNLPVVSADGSQTLDDAAWATRNAALWASTASETCVRQNADEPIRCLWGDTWQPLFTRPVDQGGLGLAVFVQQSRYDWFALLGIHGLTEIPRVETPPAPCVPPSNPSPGVQAWAARTTEALSAAAPNFSGNCVYHTAVGDASWVTFGPDAAHSLQAAVGRFWAGDVTQQVFFP